MKSALDFEAGVNQIFSESTKHCGCETSCLELRASVFRFISGATPTALSMNRNGRENGRRFNRST